MENDGYSLQFLLPENYLTSPHREAELAGFYCLRKFILDYIDYHADPFSFLVDGGSLEITSESNVVILRAEIMFLWLLGRSTSQENFTLGRSFFAEIYYSHILYKIFLNTNYNVILLPTSLDSSSELERGGDLLLCRIDYENGNIFPILFIDITTLQSRTSIKRKRRRPPINNTLNVPVIVLPVGGIDIKSLFGGTYASVEFMDNVLRVLIANGSYKALEPLVGISKRGKIEFIREVLRLFSHAIENCNRRLEQSGLTKVSDDVIGIIEELSRRLEDEGIL